jgi:Kef-type K+ transport system membrane component KefB
MVTLFQNPHESALATFLMQVFITLIVCKILAKILSFIGQPQVIGQIIAGIIFGPSILGTQRKNNISTDVDCIYYGIVLGYVPGWSVAIWPTSSLKIFQLVANMGLIFFMFFLGLELDLTQIKANWKVTIPVACSSIIFPSMYNSLVAFTQSVF